MIWDRTQNDVDTAIRIRSDKVQKFEELTDADVAVLEKGFLTINTLNRIEDKQTELKNLFNQMGYYNVEVENISWDYVDYFLQADFDRLLDNLQKLVDAFYVYKDTPSIPENNYRKYQVINDLEKILNDLDVMINDVKSRYRECGTFECGEANGN